ncbi:MAG: GrpB family protein [Clostridia bacterium]|nr:GrpB family protein [Clostridia bacterium]
MNKKALNEMTLQELWELFPIVLTKHQDCWSGWYKEEVNQLKDILPHSAKYYHIGSTAIKDIWAKPIIDILIVVNNGDELKNTADTLQQNGYIIMSSTAKRISLNKGYTQEGFAQKVFHLHLRLDGDIDEIYFKDFLNDHPDVAKQYEELKLQLWKTYEHDRDAYTQAKSEFVNKYTQLAKQTLI